MKVNLESVKDKMETPIIGLTCLNFLRPIFHLSHLHSVSYKVEIFAISLIEVPNIMERRISCRGHAVVVDISAFRISLVFLTFCGVGCGLQSFTVV